MEYGFKDIDWQEASEKPCRPPHRSFLLKYAAGNHDTLLGGLNRYEAYCDPKGMALQSGTQLWQRVDVGNIHFLVIDLEWSAENFNTAQRQWLETELASIPKDDWKIVDRTRILLRFRVNHRWLEVL